MDSDRLCHECVILVAREAENRAEGLSQPLLSRRQLGHTAECLSCGISLGRRTGRRLHSDFMTRTLRYDRSIEMDYIASEIFSLQVPEEAFACHSCWMRAHNNVSIAAHTAQLPELPRLTTSNLQHQYTLLIYLL